MIRAVIFDMYETLITHYDSPLYFSTEMAADAGIPLDRFQRIWRETDHARTIGELTLEQVLERIFREHQGIENVHGIGDYYSVGECQGTAEGGTYLKEAADNRMQRIVAKRTGVKEELFNHLHPEIVLMLEGLRAEGYLIGLISNCFSEEAQVIRKSILFPYFDAVCLSYEQGLAKPDRGIYEKCVEMLDLKPEQCLYVGDGGSRELEAARDCGMHPVQAVWYFKEGTMQPVGRKAEFVPMETPLEVLRYVREQKERVE